MAIASNWQKELSMDKTIGQDEPLQFSLAVLDNIARASRDCTDKQLAPLTARIAALEKAQGDLLVLVARLMGQAVERRM
jgi:hypothetical protein